MVNRVSQNSEPQAEMYLEPPLIVAEHEYPSWYRERFGGSAKRENRSGAAANRSSESSDGSRFNRDVQSDLSYPICGEIETVVRRHASFPGNSGSYKDTTALVSDFNASLAVVAQFTDDFRTMLESLCSFNLEFHCLGIPNETAKNDFLGRRREYLLNIVREGLMRPNPYTDATVERMSLTQAEEYLRRRLEQAIRNFSVQVCHTLDKLCDQSIVGVVDWTTSTACNAYFAKNSITQDELSKEESIGEEKLTTVNGRPVLRQKTTTTTQGQHVMEYMLCPSYLSKASSHCLYDYRGTIPIGIKDFVQHFPPWLHELARIVDGMRQSARVIKVLVEAETYETVKIVPRDYPAPNSAYCPVVTIGHFVLAGWGAEDNVLEESRQSGWNMLVVAAMLLLTACLLLFLGHPNHPVCIYGAAIGWGLSLISYARSVRDRAISKEQPATVRVLASECLRWFGISFGVLVLTIGLLRGALFLELLGLCCLAIVATLFFWRQLVPKRF